jgi:hypothetical protein
MSRRQTPHQKREKSRSRRALDRAIVRAVQNLSWFTGNGDACQLRIAHDSSAELVGLCLARRRL